jgi:hypothetical protein
MNDKIRNNHTQELSEKVDLLINALLLLTNMLRCNRTVDGVSFINAIPESVLDRVEHLVTYDKRRPKS